MQKLKFPLNLALFSFLSFFMVSFGLSNCVSSATSAPEIESFSPGQFSSIAVSNPSFPLKLSSNSAARYLVDQNDQPFFFVGEAAWSLIGQVSLPDAQLYLDDLAARGYNTVITTLVEGYYADNAPANYYGVQPYIPANDFSSPNEAYFAHADAVINYAATKGILVILSPNYLGCCSDGWRSVLENQNTVQDAQNYGSFIGTRYASFPNLIYAWGNDMNPDNTNVRDKINAMALAVKAADPNHLHTFHAAPEFSSWEIENMYNYSWVDFNSVYTYNPVQTEVWNNYNPDFNLTTPPPMPLFLFEAHYENDWAGKDALITRRQGYVAVLTGASGYAYGNNPIWHMNGHPTWTTTDWHLHLNDTGRADMTHFRALFLSRDWVSLIPDLNNTLVTGNKGSGENYSAAAMTADDNTAIIYFPNNKTITVAMNQLNGTTANVWWFNPRDGSAQAAGTLPTTGSQQFTPPNNNDWLLVLDNSSENLPAPGVMPTPTPTPLPTSTGVPTMTPTLSQTNSPTPQVTATSGPSSTPQITMTPALTATPRWGISPAYPLKLSNVPGTRYLVDQSNQPFFFVGEAAWSLMGQVSLEDAQLYLDDLAARGYNTVITTLVEGFYADNAPANYYGVQPYIPADDFSSPNEAYFAHADAVINYAASKGILVLLSPNYLGCCNDGWRSVLENQNTIQDASSFGTYVGNRYKDFPNILYVWGNDMNPDNTNVRDKINAMAEAAKAADPNHLHTYHASPEFSAWEIRNMVNYDWVDFNSVYTYNPVQGEVISNYDPDNNQNTAPPMPLFLFEAHYENDWGARDALTTRRQGYVAVLTGASGYAYGNNPIWHMNGHPYWSTTDWHLHLNDEGRADMTHFRALFLSRNWVSLIPDLDNSLVTVNKGSGEEYSAAAMTADSNTAIIYFPYNKTVTVAISQLNGTTVNVWWFNPRDGSAQFGGTLPATGSHQFSPPDNNDWLLVLDNADENLPAPGGDPQPPPLLDSQVFIPFVSKN